MSGVLYLVPTPIGNLEDITLRAIRVLAEADLIACEDTRRSIKLLNHLNIKKPLISYYEHNKRFRGVTILSELEAGKKVACISDAGMPGISDPGIDLVRLSLERGIQVVVLPGPSAGLCALVASGFCTDEFYYGGFLPREKSARAKRIRELGMINSTIILYEAPHRICAVLRGMAEVFPERLCCIARELTKKFEEIKQGTVKEMCEFYERTEPKGEFVLLLDTTEPISSPKVSDNQLLSELLFLIESGITRKEAARQVAKRHGISSRQVYGLGL